MSSSRNYLHQTVDANLQVLMKQWLTMQRTKDIAKISLGAEAVNELLGGGLETKCITEMFGEFRHAILCC